jgi:hypothetical protein
MEALLQRDVIGASYSLRRSNEGTERYIARLIGDPQMVRTTLPDKSQPAGGADMYVGTTDPNNPVQVIALVPLGSAPVQSTLSDLRWSRLHFSDPDRSRVLVRTQPSSVDPAAADALVLRSLPGPHERADKREYEIPTMPGERPIKGVLMDVNEKNVPHGVSRLCPEVSLFTLVWSKNSWLERT